MPFNALQGKKRAAAFPRYPKIPDTSGKDKKNFRLQVEAFQRVTGKMNKTSKKDEEKACAGEKDVYFCTRNNGEVLTI